MTNLLEISNGLYQSARAALTFGDSDYAYELAMEIDDLGRTVEAPMDQKIFILSSDLFDRIQKQDSK